MGPYLGERSLTYKMKCLPDAATWKRFPTMGQPGGPGGSLTRFEFDLRENKKIKDNTKKARVVKMM